MKVLQFSLKDCLVFIFAIACALGFIRMVYVGARLHEFLARNPWPSPYCYLMLVFGMGWFVFWGIWSSYYYGHRSKK